LKNGEIHIDHIIPCEVFDLTIKEHQLVCFNYKNLQPLWSKDNLSKNDSHDILDMTQYIVAFKG